MPEKKKRQNGQFHYNLLHLIRFKCNRNFLCQEKKRIQQYAEQREKLIEVLMYNHSVEDLHCVYHELIVYCKKKINKKKGGLRPSKHTQQTTESSVLPNYNPIGAVRKISEDAGEKKNKTLSLYLPRLLSSGLF